MGSAAMPAALALGVCGAVQNANAGAFLWIAAPNWSYSAAAAASPAGSIYFWALSAGAGTFTYAAAWSSDGVGDTAVAYAEARAGFGGMGGVQVAGAADPYADVGIGLPFPSYPATNSSETPTDPFSGNWSLTDTGFALPSNSGGEELNGVDELQAFVYNGPTTQTGIESLLGCNSCTIPSGTDNSSYNTGDVTDIGALSTDLNGGTNNYLEPLTNLIVNPGSLSGPFDFTENMSAITNGSGPGSIPDNVILVGEGEASAPEPSSMGLFGSGLIGLALTLRRRLRK